MEGADTRFSLTHDRAREFAQEFGTPLYVVSSANITKKVDLLHAALSERTKDFAIGYATKANSTFAVLKTIADRGCLLDCASEGELRSAIAAGVPPNQCYLHGSNKTDQELELAIDVGVRMIVADCDADLARLAEFGKSSRLPDLLIRLAPGVDPKTHQKLSTGQSDTKFGFSISDGSALNAVEFCLAKELPLIGFHCHVGSQIADGMPIAEGAERIAQFAKQCFELLTYEAQLLNVGGGFPIQYLSEVSVSSIDECLSKIFEALEFAYHNSGKVPHIMVEPGRWLVGDCGVTLYRVGPIKEVGAYHDRFISVDGGLADNPRPALYGAKYDLDWIPDPARPTSGESARSVVCGRHCEPDVLFEGTMLDSDVRAGDLIQVLCTGAYNSSMASNYNRYPRPATVLVDGNGSARIVQRRESWEEMFAREIV